MNIAPTRAPAIFISHGAPTFATEPGELGAKLGELGQSLNGIRAVVAVSPHWETPGLQVASKATPETIHDFYGFPPELYSIEYPAAGSPEVAQAVLESLHNAGLNAHLDTDRGMDHGVWVPMRHLRPAADIPVVCVSLPLDATPDSAWQLGQALAPLREQGILLLGTGSLTHNLGEFRGPAVTQIAPYVTQFANWIERRIEQRDQEALVQYRTLGPHAARAHPTEEHLLPLFFSLGASNDTDEFEVITREVRYGMLSMASYYWH